MTDLDRAWNTLVEAPELTCVLVRGTHTITSRKTGISPMLDFLLQGLDLKGFSVADRIVGKAAAMLFRLAGITHARTQVASQAAWDYCRACGLHLECHTLVPLISNRQNDGPCPMEQTVLTEQEPEKAFRLLLQKRRQLSQKAKTCP